MKEILIVIGGGILQQKTFEICGDLGLSTLLIDGDDDCYCRNKSNFFIKCSTKKPKEVLSEVKKFIYETIETLKVVGVYTQGCDVEYTVAYVASKLGLPSVGIKQAEACNNKFLTRQIFEKAKIPQPKFSVNKLNRLKLPVVVKPVDNCASRGITVVRSIEKLQKAIEFARNNSTNKNILVEEFINGNEYSIDTILYKGVMYNAGISDRVFEKKDKYAIQNGSVTPSSLPDGKQQEMFELMYKCAKAIGITWGAFKGDVIIDKQGKVYILEVTARLSGGFDSQYRKPLSYGYNLIKATIDMARGRPLDMRDITPKWLNYSKTFSILPKPGKLLKILGYKKVMQIPGVAAVFITKAIGDNIDYKNCADRINHIIICSDIKEELDSIENKVRKTLRFITK